MARTYSQVTDDAKLEDAICAFVKKVNGLKSYIAGTSHPRDWPYQTVYLRNDMSTGKPWNKKTFGGQAKTEFQQQTILRCDVDIFTKRYDERNQAIRKDPRFYGKAITNSINLDELQSDLKAVGLSLQSTNQAVASMSISEDDKWLKQGVVELEFIYLNTYQILDSDVITKIETPQINITE